MTDPNPPDWLRDPSGRVRLIVTRAFYFLQPVERRGVHTTLLQTARERKFTVGEHLLDPGDPEDAAFLQHRWLCEDFCDGYVESPNATRARLAAEAVKEAELSAAAAKRIADLTRDADQAWARTVRVAQQQSAAGEMLADELNTPLDKLSGAALDVPLSKLAAG
jgi:hypothetical protein